MSIDNLTTAVSSAVFGAIATFVNFIPSLIGGLIVFIVGLIVGAVFYRLIVGILKASKFEKFLTKYGITHIEGTDIEWNEILAELARWTIIIVFLVPTLQIWHLDAVNTVLNRVILYIPNVVVAVVLAIVGLVFAKLAYRIVYNASRSLGKGTAHTVALVAQWSFNVFVGFLILHQLGIAQELLRILFAGIVTMLALAGGLAFGLGGRDTAQQLLESAREKFKK